VRKRLVTTAIAALVIGAAAYILSQPGKDSFEWHEREYWSLRKGGSDFLGLLRWALGMGGSAQTAEESNRMMNHETLLIKNGRLVERIICVSNQPADKVLLGALPGVGTMQWSQVVFFDVTTTNTIRLVTRINDAALRLARLETLIRQADFPLTK